MRILLVEDEPKVAAFVKKGLEAHQIHCEVAFDGTIGYSMAQRQPFDVIILDVNLPGINGFDLCAKIRGLDASQPVLMLTALDSLDDKAQGFGAGADDYLAKPFELRELVLRLQALSRRRGSGSSPTQTVLRFEDLELNTSEKMAHRGGLSITLAPKEYMLLDYLLRHPGRVISKNELLERVWEVDYDPGTNVVEVCVNNLRKKIDRDFEPKLLHTVYKMGYVLRIT